MPAVPAVLLTLDKSRASSMKILHGIAAWSRHHGPWKIHTPPPFYQQNSAPGDFLKIPHGRIDGIITYITDNSQLRRLAAANVPAVVVPMKETVSGFPNITEHWQHTAALAADHLIGLGLKNFAFYAGPDRFLWSAERGRHVCTRIRKAGFEIHHYTPPPVRGRSARHEEMPHLTAWLRALPKPVGIVAWNDERGQNLIDACIAANIHIPDEVAVLGMDNDELICDLCAVPLSSIVFNHETIGYEAAALLHRMIKQKKNIRKTLTLEPLYIVTRKSTDILKSEDEDVAGAMKFIQNNTGQRLTVKKVADHLSISQRTLQKKFRRFHNRPLHDEIRFRRVERICRLLEETNLSVSQIAGRLGFSEVSDLNRCFKKLKGVTPSAYRKKYGHLISAPSLSRQSSVHSTTDTTAM